MIGGVLGAVYVTLTLFIIPRIDVANTLVAVVVGQVMAALALDHLGVLGLPIRPVTLTRAFAREQLSLACTSSSDDGSFREWKSTLLNLL